MSRHSVQPRYAACRCATKCRVSYRIAPHIPGSPGTVLPPCSVPRCAVTQRTATHRIPHPRSRGQFLAQRVAAPRTATCRLVTPRNATSRNVTHRVASHIPGRSGTVYRPASPCTAPEHSTSLRTVPHRNASRCFAPPRSAHPIPAFGLGQFPAPQHRAAPRSAPQRIATYRAPHPAFGPDSFPSRPALRRYAPHHSTAFRIASRHIPHPALQGRTVSWLWRLTTHRNIPHRSATRRFATHSPSRPSGRDSFLDFRPEKCSCRKSSFPMKPAHPAK